MHTSSPSILLSHERATTAYVLSVCSNKHSCTSLHGGAGVHNSCSRLELGNAAPEELEVTSASVNGIDLLSPLSEEPEENTQSVLTNPIFTLRDNVAHQSSIFCPTKVDIDLLFLGPYCDVAYFCHF